MWAKPPHPRRVFMQQRLLTLVGRILPISPPIANALDRRRARRDPNSPLVFHRDGVPVRRWRTGRCCTNPHWPARYPPTGFSPADAIRHWSAEGGHPIEDFAAEDYLTPLPGWTPGAKAISDDGFVAEERILHPALTMVP